MKRLVRDVAVIAIGGAIALRLHEIHETVQAVRALERFRW